MNGLKKYINKLPRLEFLLPLIYLFIATGILLYQYLVPDYIEGYDVMTGAVNIRSSDMFLIILSVPAMPFWFLFSFILGKTNMDNNQIYERLMFMISTGYGRSISLTYSFVFTPLAYYMLGLVIERYIKHSINFSKEKARR